MGDVQDHPWDPLWEHLWDPHWGTSRTTPGTPIGDTPGPPLALLRAPRGTPLGTSRAAHGTLPLLTHSPRAERTLSPHDPPEAPITPPAPPPGPMEGAVPPPGCSAISGGGGARRERRWVKYDGIGPVDETGLPLASRSVSGGGWGGGGMHCWTPPSPPHCAPQSVDRPRDWYRCMFQQIHCRLPGEHCTALHGVT